MKARSVWSCGFVLLALALGGCAPSTQNGGTTTAANTNAASATSGYQSAIDPAFRPSENTAAIYGAFRTAVPALSADDAMQRLAQAITQRVANDNEHRTPSSRVVQAMAWGLGIIDPTPAVQVTQSNNTATGTIVQQLQDTLRNGGYNVLGVAQQNAGGTTITTVVAAQRRVTLARTVPRSIHVNTRVSVEGRVSEGLRNPELVYTTPEGRTERFPLGEGPDFFGRFPVARAGTYQIELVAEGTGGTTVLANFPVYVDTPVPSTPESVAAPRTENAAQAETELFRLLNETRTAEHVSVVELMPNLSTIARAHSEEMAQQHYIAHVSPRTGQPADRIRRGGILAGQILENVARGYSARELHEALLASPGHRSNIVNPAVTHVGIGVALEPGPNGALVLTQNFIDVAAAIDTSGAPAVLLRRVNDARTRRGNNPLTPRPQLEEVARATAQAYFQERTSQRELVERAQRQLARVGLVYRQVSVLATRVNRLDEASALEPLMEREISAVGIGVAQGTRPGEPPNSIFVVYAVGYPR